MKTQGFARHSSYAAAVPQNVHDTRRFRSRSTRPILNTVLTRMLEEMIASPPFTIDTEAVERRILSVAPYLGDNWSLCDFTGFIKCKKLPRMSMVDIVDGIAAAVLKKHGETPETAQSDAPSAFQITKVDALVESEGRFLTAFTCQRCSGALLEVDLMLCVGNEAYEAMASQLGLLLPGFRARNDEAHEMTLGCASIDRRLLGASATERREIRQARRRFVHWILPPPQALLGFQFDCRIASWTQFAVVHDWRRIEFSPAVQVHNDRVRTQVMPAFARHLYRFKSSTESQELMELAGINQLEKHAAKETTNELTSRHEHDYNSFTLPESTSPAHQGDRSPIRHIPEGGYQYGA